jgi:hypothetical protein
VNKNVKCEFCSRIIQDEPVNKVLRGKKHVFCSAFCFRLFFYDAPRISYAELQKMYAYYCISLPAAQLQKTLQELLPAEEK